MNTVGRAYVAVAFLVFLLVSVPETSPAAQGDCSQPVTNGPSPAATDCLFILQVTVAIQSCDPDPCVCAPKGSLPPSATDALICLQVATGAGGGLNCPCFTSNSCENGQAPTCGGECEFGGTCAPDPLFPDDCECLNACEASGAPACNASCEDEEPGAVCESLRFTTQGGAPIDACLCLPAGTEFCKDASGPDCEGVCTPGTACESAGGGACTCVAQPPQPQCAQASSPSCGGICPDGFICEDAGGTCGCAAYNNQIETCFDADGPICGGTCAFGEQCASDFLGGCECFVPCEVGAAPACNGDCQDDGESCTVRNVSFGGSSLDFCECLPD